MERGHGVRHNSTLSQTTQSSLEQEEQMSGNSENTQAEIAAVYQLQDDKAIMRRFLELIMADVRSQRRVLDLDANEEIARLVPVFCVLFSQEELVELVGKRATNKIVHMNRIEVLQNLFLESELQRLLRAFREAQIPLMLFKGPALAYTIYPQAGLRTYHDIDALILPEDVERAHQLLTSLDYSFYNEYRADATDDNRTGYNYTLKRADAMLEVLVELHTAPHMSEIGTLFDYKDLWNHAQPISILGEQALTMAPVDHLVYLCWHYRFHGFTRMLWLYDVAMMLRTYGAELDWPLLVQTARRQRMAATLYYCLLWCRDLFGVSLPASVLAQLQPPRIARFIVERVALPAVMKELVVARYQERRIMARRAMVDRNADLLLAGMRMLFPSRLSIEKRYMEHSRLPMHFFFLYYLIHPWATLVKGCRLLLKAQRKG